MTNQKGRVFIAYAGNLNLVSTIQIFYGGRDYESLLRDDDDYQG